MSENPRRVTLGVPASRAIDGALASLLQATLAAPASLISEVDRFRMVRERSLELMTGLNAKQAVWSPRAEAWSISQIADHLVLTEGLYRGQFRTLIQAAKAGKNGPIHIGFRDVDTSVAGIPRDMIRFFELPARFVTTVVPRPIRELMIRFPLIGALNPTAATPRPGSSIQKLCDDLAASLVETENLLRAPLPPNVEEPAIVHPIMGSNNLRHLLRITIAHEERHQMQIVALRTDPSFPKP